MVAKRKNIKHFDQMSNKAFIQFMDGVSGYNDVNLKVNMKLDGFLASFGKDEDGRVWLQTGKSEKIYDPQDFLTYTRNKNKDRSGEEYATLIKRATCYKRLLFHIQGHCVDLKPGDFATCEVFDKNQATCIASSTSTQYKFVNVKYNARKFPEDYTLYVYNTNTDLIGKKYFNIEFRDPNIWNGFVKISDTVMEVWHCFEKSLKKSRLDKASAWIMKNLKAEVADDISNYSLIKEKSLQLGASEGIVIFSIPDDGVPYKIITPSFREMVKKS